MVKDRLVDRDKILQDETIVEGFSLASLLPGPVAVNTVAYIGYVLKGWQGALISFIAVLLPSFFLVIGATHFYLQYAEVPAVSQVLKTITPVILAIILSVGYKLGISGIKNRIQLLLLMGGLGIQYFISGYFSFMICFVVGAVVGLVFLRTHQAEEEDEPKTSSRSGTSNTYLLILVAAIVTGFLIYLCLMDIVYWQLLNTFGQVSLTLFGGGYVMVPLLEDLLVQQRDWLNNQEFIDAIAIGQVTPGPILISAAFVGYKLKGIIGAGIATLGIFVPSALLMVVLSNRMERIKHSRWWKSIMSGLKPMVVALILFSIYSLGRSIEFEWVLLLIFVVSSILLIRFKLNFYYLLIGAACLGLLMN